MDHGCAYVFNTLSTPHGACTLPGEDVAERWYRSLEAAEAAVAAGDVVELVESVAPVGDLSVPSDTPPALQQATEAMAAVAAEARRAPADVCHDRADEWLDRSGQARRRVVRMSLEMRLVVSVEG